MSIHAVYNRQYGRQTGPSGQQLASMAAEYCNLIDDFDGFYDNRAWLRHMCRLLSRLHVAVIDFNPAPAEGRRYCLPDDDQRCELYLHLRNIMEDEIGFITGSYCLLDGSVSDTLADDFTDMYFDLKHGLDQFEHDPQQAVRSWLNSFYQHWGIHLLDAESCLRRLQVQGSRYRIQG